MKQAKPDTPASWTHGAPVVRIIGRIQGDGEVVLNQPWPDQRAHSGEPTNEREDV